LRCMCALFRSLCGMGTFYFEKENKRILTQHCWPAALNQNKNGGLDIYNTFNYFKLCKWI